MFTKGEEWSPALRLVLACCEPPSAGRALRVSQLASDTAMDWTHVSAVARHHRVETMVFAVLRSTGVASPQSFLDPLRQRVHLLASRALSLSAETVRIQRKLDANRMPSLVLKGAAIGALAYGEQQLKSSWDIDLLLEPDDVAPARALLAEDGYRSREEAVSSLDPDRLSSLGHDKEIVLHRARDAAYVELHWRLHNNRALLGDWTPATLRSRTLEVPGGTIRTLADEDHYVYLAVHGASHAWFRLKWLADFAWWLAQGDETRLRGFHAAAMQVGAGRCSGQGLLLAHELIGLPLSAELRGLLARQPFVPWLVSLARQSIASRGGQVELAEKRLLSRLVLASQLLLSDAPGYRRAAFAERWDGVGSRTLPMKRWFGFRRRSP